MQLFGSGLQGSYTSVLVDIKSHVILEIDSIRLIQRGFQINCYKLWCPLKAH